MLVYWPSSTQLTGVAGEADDDTLTKSSHGLVDGTAVFFLAGTGFTGLTAGRRYFVRDAATNTFKLAATSGGSAVNLTADGSAGVFAAAVELADGASFQGAPGVRLDGAGVVEPVEPWESATATALARGNRSDRLPLSVPHAFTSERLAGIFFLERFAAVANAGPLLVVIGYSGDTAERYTDAVLEACSRRWKDESALVVIVDYLFRVGAFAA
jgi:hypothetical protein